LTFPVHKEKLAQGRVDARAVKAYLTYLDENKPRRGRRRTPESIAARLAAIEVELSGSSALGRLNLFQEQMDLEVELVALKEVPDGSELRVAFVEAASRYAVSKGISAAAFKMVGVDAVTLREAGIR
jgi:hypothetical protein